MKQERVNEIRPEAERMVTEVVETKTRSKKQQEQTGLINPSSDSSFFVTFT